MKQKQRNILTQQGGALVLGLNTRLRKLSVAWSSCCSGKKGQKLWFAFLMTDETELTLIKRNEWKKKKQRKNAKNDEGKIMRQKRRWLTMKGRALTIFSLRRERIKESVSSQKSFCQSHLNQESSEKHDEKELFLAVLKLIRFYCVSSILVHVGIYIWRV